MLSTSLIVFCRSVGLFDSAALGAAVGINGESWSGGSAASYRSVLPVSSINPQ